MNQIEMRAFSNEMQKIAVRWKEVMRAGELGAGDVARLRGSNLLNYGREISGLERGTAGIAKKHGLEINEMTGKGLWEGLKSGLVQKDWNPLKQQATTGLLAAQGGGGMAFPGMKKLYVAPSLGMAARTTGETRSGVSALVKRHEVDELVEGQRQAQQQAQRATKGMTPSQRMAHSITSSIMGGTPARNFTPPAVLPGPQGEKYQKWVQYLPDELQRQLRGRHSSPEVIMRESSNLATLPPAVAEHMKQFRGGEQLAMNPLGFRYGQKATPTVRSNITNAFNRQEI